ncbi:MAG: hypothetical protein ACKVT0_11355 [Planctomycetaceae bacterium]
MAKQRTKLLRWGDDALGFLGIAFIGFGAYLVHPGLATAAAGALLVLISLRMQDSGAASARDRPQESDE